MSLVRQFSGGEASEQGVEKQAFVNPLIGGRGGETAASPEEEEQEEQEESNPSPPDQAEPAGSSEGEQAKENKSRRALVNTDSIEDVVIAAEGPSIVPPEPAAKAPVPSGSSRKAIVNTDSIDPQDEALVLQLEPQPEPEPESRTDPAAAGPVSHPSRKAIINTDSIEAYREDNLDDKFERFRAATAVAPGGQKVSMGSSDGEGGSVNYIVNPLRAVSPGECGND